VERETSEIAAMVERMIKSYGRRVAASDDVDLARMLQVREAFDEAIAAAVVGQKEAGYSWAEIARGLGTTRQNAQMRFGNRSDRKVS
jgi:hypothetical protein